MADSSRLQHLRAGGRGETLTAPRDSSQQQSHQDQATGGQGKQSACSPKTQSCTIGQCSLMPRSCSAKGNKEWRQSGSLSHHLEVAELTYKKLLPCSDVTSLASQVSVFPSPKTPRITRPDTTQQRER